MSLSSAIVASWRGPRAVLRRLLAQDRSEGRLLMYLVLALGLLFVAQVPRLLRAATTEVPFDALMAGTLFALMMLGPLVLYLLAGMLALVLRLVAPVEGYAVRLALFWALLAAAPLAMGQAALVHWVGPGPLALAAGGAVFGAFAVILGAGLSVALEAARRPA
jgi:hypothetical protein